MTVIATNKVGRSATEVTVLGFGAAPMGNLYRPVSSTDAEATLHSAYAAGIRYFDTAPYYGLGLSERRVGDALRGYDDVVISTKVGRLLKPDVALADAPMRHGFANPLPFEPVYDYSYDAIMRSVEDSQQRLGIARFDIALVHDIGVVTHGEANRHYFGQLIDGGIRALGELRAAGIVSAIGLGVNEAEICERCMDLAPWDCFMLAGRYTLLEQHCLDSLLARCVQEQTSILLGGPYNSGILATGTRGSGVPQFNYEPASDEVIDRVRRIEAVCDVFDVRLAAAALQFPLAHPAVASVVPGLGKPERVRATIDLLHTPIPADFWQTLKTEGLVAENAPVPGAPDESIP